MENRRLLNVRKRQKSKKPAFRRADGHKKKKLDCNWRRPRGLQGKLRKGIATKGAIAQVGYGSPRAVRGLHPSGFEEVLVRNPDDLRSIDPSYQVARIARTVGVRKRMMIEEVATAREIRILNPLTAEISEVVLEEAPEEAAEAHK
ncbi:MAG: 50S ribosomal protein L32e [Candidatus Makaraimicrobium thalassicum]|nr:MAG: 50S ribosomal protein L32e [Candidatus Omnitrophota bacterium]HDJ38479.1 50S ribosomal protein L32e [Methanosarcinales archaeon]